MRRLAWCSLLCAYARARACAGVCNNVPLCVSVWVRVGSCCTCGWVFVCVCVCLCVCVRPDRAKRSGDRSGGHASKRPGFFFSYPFSIFFLLLSVPASVRKNLEQVQIFTLHFFRFRT